MLPFQNHNTITRGIIVILLFFIGIHHTIAGSMQINKEYSSNDIISLNSLRSNLTSLSAYGEYQFHSNHYGLVRIILVDEDDNNFLVGEWDSRFDSDSKFSDICVETFSLIEKRYSHIKVVVHNATLHLDSLNWFNDTISVPNRYQAHLHQTTPDLRAQQWNKYNACHGKHWFAKRIENINYSFNDIKSVFYCDDDNYYSIGIEYYAGGLFEIDSEEINEQNNLIGEQERDTPIYASSYDWRSRHGKNWITSIKSQITPQELNIYGNGGCWAFAPIAALEAVTNLYYNKLLNLNLSEQEVGVCTGGFNSIASSGNECTTKGGSVFSALKYIQEHGVCNENCFPFVNNCTIPCSNKCENPIERISITGKSYVSPNISSFKNSIINKGPFTAGILHPIIWGNDTSICSHAMCMVGYGTIAAGDILELIPDTSYNSCYVNMIISPEDSLIGKTYWILKNSYGTTWGHNGYVYAVYPDKPNGNLIHTGSSLYTLNTPITSINYGDLDIAITDNDNDGYYFWGLGPKPDDCPICCPDTPDGDDSNPLLAEMDSYGIFAQYVFPYPTLTINADSIWNTNRTQCGNIIVTNNATLTITAELTMNPAAKIIVQNGGTLVVDGGVIKNAKVKVENSAKFQLLNNGTIYLKQFGNLNILLGAEANMEYGRILLQ